MYKPKLRKEISLVPNSIELFGNVITEEVEMAKNTTALFERGHGNDRSQNKTDSDVVKCLDVKFLEVPLVLKPTDNSLEQGSQNIAQNSKKAAFKLPKLINAKAYMLFLNDEMLFLRFL